MGPAEERIWVRSQNCYVKSEKIVLFNITCTVEDVVYRVSVSRLETVRLIYLLIDNTILNEIEETWSASSRWGHRDLLITLRCTDLELTFIDRAAK